MRTIKYMLGLLLWWAGSALYAQCSCDAQIVPTSDCCGDLELFFGPNCDPSTSLYDQLVIDPTVLPAFSGKVESVTINLPGFSTTIDPITGIATISYSGNLVGLTAPGTVITLGVVCFEDLSAGVVTSQVTVSNPSGEQCGGFTETPLNCPNAAPWAKLYGDTLDNRPARIKAFTDGVYVAGYQVDMSGVVYPTMSKFSVTSGALVWQRLLEFPGRITDLEYDAPNDELILVGVVGGVSTGPGQNASDRSFILKMDDFGNPGLRKVYDQNGREGFTRIVRHPNPANPAFPYYVLGRKNPSPTPSGIDVPVVYNFAADLTFNWAQEYQAGVEIEAYRGLVPINDGSLFLVGNGSSFGSSSNEGILIDINGLTGAWQGRAYYPGVIDLYDGVDVQNGEVALAGTDFGTDEALVYIIDRSNYNVITGFRFPGVSVFREIGRDGLQGNLYTVGRKKGADPNYHVVHSLSYINGIGGFVLNDVFYKYLYDNETAFDEPHLSVKANHDAIFYADARQNNPSGFGNYDMLIGSFDLNMTNACAEDFVQVEQAYSINQLPFMVSNTLLPEPPSFFQYAVYDPGYGCNDFCEMVACTADFTWTADCCEVQLTGIATGTGPFTYEWDINCDNLPGSPPDFTGQNVTATLPGTGTYQVCLTITDATGCAATSQQTVTVTDNPPVLNCPQSVTIPTDPDLCTATYALTDPMATDDCTTMFIYSCTMSGATSGPAISPVVLNKGITTITCVTEDSKGQMATCSYTITVEDMEPPMITCSDSINVTVPACAGGSIVNFNPPMVTDNCPMVTYICSHNSGDFFPCGTTMVTCTATDMAGNQTTCVFPITVDCECAEVGNESIECTAVDDQFAFSVDVIDLTGAGAGGCTVSVSTSQAGVTISNVAVSGTGPGYTVTGLIDVAAPPMPNSIAITVTVNCICPDGSTHSCSFPIVFATPCCKEIRVAPQEVCKTDGTVQIPLLGCNTLYDVQQVRWYVADAPCPPTSWGLPFQVTNGCSPLTLSPQYHSGDVCVYAEVVMGAGAGPCTMLVSNIVTITLCEPVSCSVADQAYCYTGSPITPAPLVVTLNPTTPNCTYTLQWYDPNGNAIPGATNPTYQPGPLSFTGSATDCSQSYVYTVIVSSPACGDQSCSATIRLDNEAAPVGTLTLLPPDTNPLCYGEDAVLEYMPECAGQPARWDWFIRPISNSSYTALPTNGDRNPLYFTNRLYQDTWVKVEKTNGVCPADEIELLLDIIDPLVVNNFTADYSPICAPTSVDLEVDFAPSPAPVGCTYTVFWYQGGSLIHTSVHTTTTATYTYTPPAGGSLGGNYYCIIESSCCPQRVKSPVVTLAPPMEVYAVGPCFRCNCDTITLQGIVLYPIAGFNCTYQWYDNGVLLPGETGLALTVDPTWSGPFTFEVTCTDGVTTCVQTDSYNLLQCGTCMVAADDLVKLNAEVYPTPTSGQVTVWLETNTDFEAVEVFDLQGRMVQQIRMEGAVQSFQLDISDLPNGVYVLRAISKENELLIQQLIKQ
ncbi:HYR domain-containing protein [Lewinella cohaerens]|uniref:HYR domain-containing protein n=1 Tax=Lewinella cohaerens TaxID=70995 RepID=UPI0003A0DC6E|nr:HYR domain-containing protein [Lewinella cohaerens]